MQTRYIELRINTTVHQTYYRNLDFNQSTQHKNIPFATHLPALEVYNRVYKTPCIVKTETMLKLQ